MNRDELRARVAEVLPGIRADLEDLVRIESVSADPARAAEVRRSAEAVRALFEAEGCEAVIVSAADGAAPAVIAHAITGLVQQGLRFGLHGGAERHALLEDLVRFCARALLTPERVTPQEVER